MMGRRTERFSFNEWTLRRRRSNVSEATCMPGSRPTSGARDLTLLEGLDHVALAEILVVGQPDAALEALVDLANVVLESLQGRDRTLPYDHTVPEEPNLRAPGYH